MKKTMASPTFSFSEWLLSLLGVLVVLWLLLKAVWKVGHIVRVFLLSEVWKGVSLTKYGSWAVVTGATAGIGKAYAFELAKRGFDVVLISRSVEKLNQVAAEIEGQHGRRTKVIQADFTHGLEIYEPIQAALQGLEIGVLVNNVGISLERPVRFLSIPDGNKHVNDFVNCNMLPMVKMSQIVLPQMVSRKKGIVINLSSFLGRRPYPLTGLYSASKAFNDFFSRVLEMEYGPQGIIVQSVLPMYVDTNMIRNINGICVVPPNKFVHQALNTVGLTDRTSGCLSHTLLASVCHWIVPDWLHLSPFASFWFMFASTLITKPQ